MNGTLTRLELVDLAKIVYSHDDYHTIEAMRRMLWNWAMEKNAGRDDIMMSQAMGFTEDMFNVRAPDSEIFKLKVSALSDAVYYALHPRKWTCRQNVRELALSGLRSIEGDLNDWSVAGRCPI